MTRLLLALSLFLSCYTYAQQRVRFVFPDALQVRLKSINIKHDTLINSAIQQALLDLYAAGYLTPTVDSIKSANKQTMVYGQAGPRFSFARLQAGNADEGMLSTIGFRERIYYNEPLDPQKISTLFSRVLDYYEERGYPFASARLDQLILAENALSASLLVNPGPYITIDSLVIKGNAGISTVYMEHYTGIRQGAPFNQKVLSTLDERLRELPFVNVVQDPELLFTTEGNKVILYLEKKRASNFDGVLGILPDDNIAGKYLITGDVRLRLLSALGRGEAIDVRFRKLQTQTQELKAGFRYPYLFRTPLGADVQFDLFKRDTTFLNVNRMAGLQYLTGAHNFFKVFVRFKTSSLLSSTGFENLVTLPEFADVSVVQYGIGGYRERFDYRYNPTRGYSIDFSAAAGTRNIIRNSALPDTVYAGVDLRQVQYDLQLTTQYFIPVFPRGTVRLAADGAWLISERVFRNEMYRLGGFNSLRGFDEESIFASAYIIGTAEVRYLLERNSFAHVFWNHAYHDANLEGQFASDTPFGFGAGLSFETKAGIFSLSYALGSQLGNPVLLRNGKIHFGISSLF